MAVMCGATTRQGHACRRRVRQPYCWQHPSGGRLSGAVPSTSPHAAEYRATAEARFSIGDLGPTEVAAAWSVYVHGWRAAAADRFGAVLGADVWRSVDNPRSRLTCAALAQLAASVQGTRRHPDEVLRGLADGTLALPLPRTLETRTLADLAAWLLRRRGEADGEARDAGGTSEGADDGSVDGAPADLELAAIGTGLRLVGVYVCARRGALVHCACLRTLAKDAGGNRLKDALWRELDSWAPA
ncbi:hypothetical protein CLV63_14310 [Murinocardiopsis flavida]|uniref:Uncharacterized protein n=1 Tax=Murinocardiopsis flavida TaxID=645275 RepID=A0A2P8CB81_9ACTN|nr:hypothetical protein [Murinocardiopsis flavida]PSK82240.1 hypothetical protein CLV63_14310 [Murinocardiopsis flavida]